MGIECYYGVGMTMGRILDSPSSFPLIISIPIPIPILILSDLNFLSQSPCLSKDKVFIPYQNTLFQFMK